MNLAFHPLKVSQIRRDTPDSVVISFDVPDELRATFSFTQGQYLTLRRQFDQQDVRRAYSICNGVDEDPLRVGVRRLPNSLFSSWLHDGLRVGEVIDVMPPQGRFHVPLQASARRHYLGVAVGSGITPILSILKSVLSREPDSRFTLVYGNKAQDSTMFLEELAEVKDRYIHRFALHHIFSREESDLPIQAGRLDARKMAHLFDTAIRPEHCDHIFVCGPEAVKDTVEQALQQRGFPPERLHIERFGAPKVASPLASALTSALASVASMAEGVSMQDAASAKPRMITILRDGQAKLIEMQAHHDNVLDAAQASGLDLPYSCQSGVCCTCKAKVLQGRATMARNFALDEQEVADGFVLACQCRPEDEALVLSFDER